MKMLKLFALVLAALGMGACAYNPAQMPADGVEKDQPPVMREVTGSRIPTELDPDDPYPKTRVPVTIITRDEIDRSGAIGVSGVLRNHPAIWSTGGR